MPLERIFTQEDSYFLSGKDLARGYQRYVEKHDLVSGSNFCTGSLLGLSNIDFLLEYLAFLNSQIGLVQYEK